MSEADKIIIEANVLLLWGIRDLGNTERVEWRGRVRSYLNRQGLDDDAHSSARDETEGR